MAEEAISLNAAARIAGVSPSTLRRWARTKVIPVRRGRWTAAAAAQARVVARMRERGHSLAELRARDAHAVREFVGVECELCEAVVPTVVRSEPLGNGRRLDALHTADVGRERIGREVVRRKSGTHGEHRPQRRVHAAPQGVDTRHAGDHERLHGGSLQTGYQARSDRKSGGEYTARESG